MVKGGVDEKPRTLKTIQNQRYFLAVVSDSQSTSPGAMRARDAFDEVVGEISERWLWNSKAEKVAAFKSQRRCFQAQKLTGELGVGEKGPPTWPPRGTEGAQRDRAGSCGPEGYNGECLILSAV